MAHSDIFFPSSVVAALGNLSPMKSRLTKIWSIFKCQIELWPHRGRGFDILYAGHDPLTCPFQDLLNANVPHLTGKWGTCLFVWLVSPTNIHRPEAILICIFQHNFRVQVNLKCDQQSQTQFIIKWNLSFYFRVGWDCDQLMRRSLFGLLYQPRMWNSGLNENWQGKWK